MHCGPNENFQMSPNLLESNACALAKNFSLCVMLSVLLMNLETRLIFF